MIFAAETEERSLHVFPDALTAATYCEALDVEATVWLFWDDDGSPLQPQFTIPNKRGLFTAINGIYHLVPALGGERPALLESLSQIRQVIGEPPFTSVRSVHEYLAQRMSRQTA
ncbi:MAG: hypothetical protein ACLGI6_13305 [Gammaproteobacteria bacterium]